MSFKNFWAWVNFQAPEPIVVEKVVEKIVEKIVEKPIPVVGDAIKVKLYMVKLPNGHIFESSTRFGSGIKYPYAVTVIKYFLTCQQAHAAGASAEWPAGSYVEEYVHAEGYSSPVTEVEAILVGGEYFPITAFGGAIKVEPKTRLRK